MQDYCKQHAGQWQVPPGDGAVPRWIAYLFWFVPRFVREWTSDPSFPRPYRMAYYEAAYQRLDDLAWWFFFGQSPYKEGTGFGPLEP